jgi:hypothetical protein
MRGDRHAAPDVPQTISVVGIHQDVVSRIAGHAPPHVKALEKGALNLILYLNSMPFVKELSSLGFNKKTILEA